MTTLLALGNCDDGHFSLFSCIFMMEKLVLSLEYEIQRSDNDTLRSLSHTGNNI